MKLPRARNENIVVQNLDKEVLLYDLNTHKAFNLNETSAVVYQACDGQTFLNELKAKSNFTDEIIYLALDELKQENLIEESEKYDSPFAGMSRREAIRKVGFASMIALPVIASLIAPTAAHAQSSGAVAPCIGSSPDSSFVSTSATGSSDSAARAACLSNLDCQCASGGANGSIGICAGAPSFRACTCSGTCAISCVNSGGSSSGSPVSTSATGNSDSAARMACLSSLDSQCCSGDANGSIAICAGAPSFRACTCNGTCT